MRTDIADGLVGFIFKLLQLSQKLFKKQPASIQCTAKTVRDAFQAFHRTLESECSRPGPSF